MMKMIYHVAAIFFAGLALWSLYSKNSDFWDIGIILCFLSLILAGLEGIREKL